ncbi:hypothetical protein [Leptotrichia sp. OH3620_COT-345]|nr:hypothetical protein [Leptotrichia sp. OH3620_COT-345]
MVSIIANMDTVFLKSDLLIALEYAKPSYNHKVAQKIFAKIVKE